MKRTIIALCMVLTIFVGSSMVSQAAVCSNSPDKVHHFDGHKKANAGYTIDGGTHQYLYGYEGEKPIYLYNCRLTHYMEYCYKQCIYCSAVLEGSTHEHLTNTRHSISHQ